MQVKPAVSPHLANRGVMKYRTKNKECQNGNHIPVATVTKSGKITSVYCQECGVPMTREQHEMYFEYYEKRMLELYGNEWLETKKMVAG